jgi:hypothetical protein
MSGGRARWRTARLAESCLPDVDSHASRRIAERDRRVRADWRLNKEDRRSTETKQP